MKILYLVHNQYDTGALPKIIEHVEAVAALGHTVTLVCTSPKERFRKSSFEKNGVRFIITPSLAWGKFRQGADILDAVLRVLEIRKTEYDIIHAVDSRPTVILPAIYMKRYRGCPLVLEWTDWFGRGGVITERSGRLYALTLGWIETFFEERFRRYADKAIVISTMLEKRLLSLGYPKERIVLQRYGCDLRKGGFRNKKESRKKLGLPPENTILCYVGNCYPSDLNLLVESLEILKAKNGRAISTVLIGNHLLDRSTVERLDIILAGFVDLTAVYEYLNASDLCLIPMKESLANRSRWPSKFADYLNAGRPTIATRVSDFEMLFSEHGLGFLAENDTPEAFSASVEEAVMKEHLHERIGRNARRYAETYLSVSRLAAERVALYEEILSGSGRSSL